MTSGGDAPGMNAAVRAVARAGASRGVEVRGVRAGFDGLIDGEFTSLTGRRSRGGLTTSAEIEATYGRGGTWLGSSRCARFFDPRYRGEAAANLAGTGGLVIVGGSGSMSGAAVLSDECEVPIVGIPASIDNDIGCTSSAVGVDTALNTIVEACDRISDTARAHHRAFIVEVMGRESGYLAMASAVAANADCVLVPERRQEAHEILQEVVQAITRSFAEPSRRRVLVIKAEGVQMATQQLVSEVVDALRPDLPDVEVRATVLGHLVRGGSPSFMDRMIGGRMGMAAVDVLLEEQGEGMLAWHSRFTDGRPTDDPALSIFAFDRVVEETERLRVQTSSVVAERMRMMDEYLGILAL